MFLFFWIVMFVYCLLYVSYVCWWWWEMHWRIGGEPYLMVDSLLYISLFFLEFIIQAFLSFPFFLTILSLFNELYFHNCCFEPWKERGKEKNYNIMHVIVCCAHLFIMFYMMCKTIWMHVFLLWYDTYT